MNDFDHQELRTELRRLADSLGEPRPELEQQLLQRFRRSSARRRRSQPWVWAAAAVLALGLAMGAWLARREPPQKAPPAVASAEDAQPGPFLLLDYGRPTNEITPGRLVRVTLPPSAPAWFGLPVDPAAHEGIEADVLLGDDGVAQAVRLVGNRETIRR
ncbi:MAG: hypothetical protein H6509_14795 [Bryobacterales bacterium]|nr:hypothetical protein [Bryobacterales bacterium]